MLLNKQYSFADFTGRQLLGRDPSEFSNTTIKGSCFSHETPETQVFPNGTSGVRFEKCNLCNVALPPGSTTDDRCQTTRFRAFAMKDTATQEPSKDEHGQELCAQDWEIDGTDKPVRPLNVKSWEQDGRSVDPKDYVLTASSLVVSP